MKTVIRLPKLSTHEAGAEPGDATTTTTTGRETQPGMEFNIPSAAPTRSSRETEDKAQVRARGPFVPLALACLALLGWMAFQSWLLLNDRQALQSAHASQQQTVDNAGKLRGSLDTLAADTQRLADAGNGSARLLVEELKKRGVTINPAATGPGPTPK